MASSLFYLFLIDLPPVYSHALQLFFTFLILSLSVCLSVCPFVCLSICPSICSVIYKNYWRFLLQTAFHLKCYNNILHRNIAERGEGEEGEPILHNISTCVILDFKDLGLVHCSQKMMDQMKLYIGTFMPCNFLLYIKIFNVG